jgi:hypothetical protein
MNAQIIDHIVTTIGLLADVAGAVLLAWGLFISPDEAIQLRGQSGLSFYSNGGGATREQMLGQRPVIDLLRQSRLARWGCPLLVLGFLFQLAGTWLPQILEP